MTVGQIEMMPQHEFIGWIEFYACEPWGLAVADTFNAHAISVQVNLERDAKTRPEPYAIKDFLVFPEPVSEAEPVDPPTVDGKTAEQWKLIFAAEALQSLQAKSKAEAETITQQEE